MMNDKPVVPLTTPPTKKMNIGIKIGIVFVVSFVLFFVGFFAKVLFGGGILGDLLQIALPILVIIFGIPLVLILHYAIK